MASSSGTSQETITDQAFKGVGNLIKLLPTGTFFLYKFVNPVLTNYGKCSATNKYLTSIFLGVCGFSCFFSSFTDSYTASDGKTYYGLVTKKGLWPSSSLDSGKTDLSEYKLRVGDFIHAFLSMIVFAVVALLDPNTVGCFYPYCVSTQKVLLMVLPPIVGVFASSVFVMFPNKRHGIGYPSNQTSQTQDDSAFHLLG